MKPEPSSQPGQLLAYINEERTEGPILAATGGFQFECKENGAWSIEDHEIPTPDWRGLLIFEGWTYYGPGPEPDVSLAGEWRRLTHWEMCQLRFGQPIFEASK